MKIRPVSAELFHANGQTDMTKLIVAFRDFGKAPKKTLLCKTAFTLVQVSCPDHKPSTNMNNIRTVN
jgi:hypothetical protein